MSQYDQVDLAAELSLTQNQLNEYKSKYQQASLEIAGLKQENDRLREQLTGTQSLRGTDPRQAEDLKRNVQALQAENQQLRSQITNLENQQQNVVGAPQNSLDQQRQLLSLESQIKMQGIDMQQLRQQLENKTKDYEQLKVRVQARDFINNLPPGQEQNRLMVLQRENQRLNQIIEQKSKELEDQKYQTDALQVDLQDKQQLTEQMRQQEDKILGLSKELEQMLTNLGGLRNDMHIKEELARTRKDLQQKDGEAKDWKMKYENLERDSQNLADVEKRKADLEDRVEKMQLDIDKIELENRGLQLRQQAFDRLLKEKETYQQKIQEMDSQIAELEKQISEKRRENENLKRQSREKDEDFQNFKENIYRPQEDRTKRLEQDIENWRNKCLALENNFFGNTERFYVENEFKRFSAQILSLQQENEELKVKLRVARQNQQAPIDNSNEERTKLLYAERERLFGELEQVKRKNAQLESELNGVKVGGFQNSGVISSGPQIKIIQNPNDQNGMYEAFKEKDKQIDQLKQGIEELLDENKELKRELDKLQLTLEQAEIQNNFLIQRHQQAQGFVSDLNDPRKIQDHLEQKSYEVQEWKDRYHILQGQLRQKEQVNQNPRNYSNALLEDEFKRLRNLYELKTLEAEEYKQRLMEKDQSGFGKREQGANRIADLETELRKYQNLLQIRTVEREEWRARCLKNPNSEDLTKLRQALDFKSREAEEYKIKHLEALKGRAGNEELMGELRRHQKVHEMKAQEIQDLHQKKEHAEFEHRKTKQVLEQLIIENEQLKRKMNSGLSNANLIDRNVYERQIKDLHLKVQQLEKEVAEKKNNNRDLFTEHERLKSAHNLREEQIRNVALSHKNLEQRNKDLLDENDKLKQGLRDKHKDFEDLKKNHLQLQQHNQNNHKLLQMQQGDKQKEGQNQESLKAQITILQSRIQDLQSKNQQLTDQLTKLTAIIKDITQQKQKLEQAMQKQQPTDKQREKELQMATQMTQMKVTLDAKQKENEQLKAAFMQAQKKIQDYKALEAHISDFKRK